MSKIKKRSIEDMDIDYRLRVILCKIGHLLHNLGDGKTSQGRILSVINENDCVLQSDLREYLDIKASSLSEILKKLEDNELIIRFNDPKDHRMIMIKLTPKGQKEVANKKMIRKAENKKITNLHSALQKSGFIGF